MANVKGFADTQTDKWTDVPKTICPDLSMQTHKKKKMLENSNKHPLLQRMKNLIFICR